jgi:glycogen debranching enzyme
MPTPHEPAPDAPRRSGANIGIRDPRRDVAHEGYTVLVTRPDGRFGLDREEGLFDFDARVLSWWELRVNGEIPEFVSSSKPDVRRWGSVLRRLMKGGGPGGPRLPQDAIEIQLHRRVGCGMEERIELRNHSMAPTEVRLGLELGADFADVVEAKKGRRHGGRTTRRWTGRSRRLTFEHIAEHEGRTFERAVRVTVQSPDGSLPIRMEPARPRADAEAGDWRAEAAARLRVDLELAPHERRTLILRYESRVDGRWRSPLEEHGEDALTAREHAHREWRRGAPVLDAANAVLADAFRVAGEDLWDLRNFDLDGDDPDSWMPNAGVPFYTGAFGRDSLLAGLTGAMFGPQPLDGALRWAADTQGTRTDDATEEQPGRMFHEIRRGPLSDLRIIPQHRFYGAHTTSTLFPWALAEHWHWTADLDTVNRHRDAALRAIDWAARDGDRDGDGFLDYVAHSDESLKNEAWKDSAEAIRYPDGRLVENPVATVEEQAFHITALERTAELLLAIDEPGRAEELLGRASELRRRWHEAYWMPDAGTYALALDRDKEQVGSITSNPGHALAVGVVPTRHAASVVERLMAADLFSGWGVRTLSSEHPSYNPLAYHLGAVWPFENALFVHGMRRYGFDEPAERLLTALFVAAGHFDGARLPELFGGHGADELPFPTVYPDTNVPQAWTAAAIGLLVQSMLGLVPIAPAETLALVRPRLPAWLPHATIRNLRVGQATVSIRFERQSDGATAHEVLETAGRLRVIRSDEVPGEVPGAMGGLEAVWSGDGTSPVGRALRVGVLGAAHG